MNGFSDPVGSFLTLAFLTHRFYSPRRNQPAIMSVFGHGDTVTGEYQRAAGLGDLISQGGNGGVALTVYGAMEMYGVINVGVITTLKWALLVLFIVNFSWIAIAFTSVLPMVRASSNVGRSEKPVQFAAIGRLRNR